MSEQEPAIKGQEELSEGTLISHLVELRGRFVKAAISILAIFICLAPFSGQTFKL